MANMTLGAVLETAKKLVGNTLNGTTITGVELVDVPKGGIVLKGLHILTDADMNPIIYDIENFSDEMDVFDAVEKAVDSLRTERPSFDVTDRSLWRVKAVNYEACKATGYLDDKAYVQVLDLAVVCCIEVKAEEHFGNICVPTALLDTLGVTVEEFVQVAIENDRTPLKSMREVLMVLMQIEPDDPAAEFMLPPESDAQMFVYADERGADYATGLFCNEERLREFHERLGDFLIIPSSIHELLIVPMNGLEETDFINGMIGEVNNSCVGEGEVLSDHAYLYDGELKAA